MSLLSTLGVETLSRPGRDEAQLRVEFLGDIGRTHGSAPRLRVYRSADQDGGDATEFEASNACAAASFIFSEALGLALPLLAGDETMFALIRTVVRAAQADSPIVVTGETGTGKELLVRMIHGASLRAGGIFSVNCAALNDTVAANERRGIDGAASGGPGRLDALFAASGTTLFLDQVAELSPASQTWVLHALTRVADGAADGRSGARLVAATNRPLEPLVLSGEFRRELHDRLAVLTITIPPLRERRAEFLCSRIISCVLRHPG